MLILCFKNSAFGIIINWLDQVGHYFACDWWVRLGQKFGTPHGSIFYRTGVMGN